MNRTRKTLAAGLAVGALSLGAVVPAVAADTEVPDTPRLELREQRRAEHQETFAAALAEELGIDVDEVADALEAVHETMQAERETIRAEREANGYGAGTPAGRGGRQMGPADGSGIRHGAGPRGNA